jgi:hypothetical protein
VSKQVCIKHIKNEFDCIYLDPCHVRPSMENLNLICGSDYSSFNEEDQSFLPGWIMNTTTMNFSSSVGNAFKYKSSKELDTYAYMGDHGKYYGDGYMYEFRGRLTDLQSNLSQLHQFEWIDKKTRAVIIQLTLYNPNVGMFTSVILLAEFLSTGGVFPSSQIDPLNFQGLYLFYFWNIKLSFV